MCGDDAAVRGDDAAVRSDDAAARGEGGDAFPTLRIRRHVALIGLSTALPSAPFLATGRLGEKQLARLDALLEQTGRDGLFRIVLLHHPPASHTVRWRKSLRDGAALRDVLARRGAELTLHGHAHFSAAAYLDGARGRNLAIGVPSASAIGKHVDRYATYHLYRIRRSEDGWKLARRGAGLLARPRPLRSGRRAAPPSGARGGAGLNKLSVAPARAIRRVRTYFAALACVGRRAPASRPPTP